MVIQWLYYNNKLVYDTQIINYVYIMLYTVDGIWGYKPTYKWGAHPVGFLMDFM